MTQARLTPAYEAILYEERGPTALITYNRPDKRNAWNVALTREVMDAVRRANACEQVRVIVLTGAGPMFSAGVDIKASPEPKDEKGRSPTPGTLTMGQGEQNWLALLRGSKPTIAAVNGPAMGLGATHALSADIRVAAKSASFAFPFTRLGAMPECGSTALLGQLIGFGRAMDLCLRAKDITADEALRIGLVTQVFPDESFLAEALALAERLASFPALQLQLTKRMLWDNVAESDPDAIMRRESSAFVEMLRTRGRGTTF